MRKIFYCVFFLYCMMLAELLLIGRETETLVSIREYFILYANALPFETLIRYISFFIRRRDLDSFLLAFSNIGGNFLLFLPMGFFLPVLFSRMRRCEICLFLIFCTVLTAELLQGFLRVGVPDIDDLTVNVFGAYIGFLISEKFCFCRQAPS